MNMRTMTGSKARRAGYRALTVGYRVPAEQEMLDRVLGDLRRGNVAHVLVKERRGFSVWRKAGGRKNGWTGCQLKS